MDIKTEPATKLVDEYYTSYAKYVLETRALPSIYDGLKHAQRRLLFVASKLPKDKFNKSSKVLGNTIPYHPHSLDALYGSLVGITTDTSRLNLIDGKGNWGGINFEAAAYRYTECKLNEVGNLGYTQFIKDAKYIQGESGLDEPEFLPALIPYSSIIGTYGIGVGLSTNVMPLNLIELIDYYIDTIKGNKPKIPTPDIGNFIIDMDDKDIDYIVNSYKGTLHVKSRMIQESNNILVIKDLNRPIKSVIKKIQDWIDDGKVDYRNESTSESRYVFEIMDNSITMPMLRKRLNKALMSHITFTRLLVDKDKAVYSTLEYQTKKSLDYLNKVLDHKFKRELNELNKQEKVLLVIDYIKNNLANKLHKMNKDDLRKELQKQNFDDESINKAIVKPITYLTSEHNDELKIIKQQQKNIKNINRTDYLVNLYEEFKKVVKPIYDSKSHSIRRSKLLKNPKIKLMDKNTIRISNRGMNYKDSILIVKKDGYVIPESIYTKVKTFIHKDYDITGIVTDEYPYVVLISNTDGIICIEYNSINYAKEVVNLGKGEYITDVIPATINRRKNIKFIYNKKEYNANHFVKKRKSKLTYNWR